MKAFALDRFGEPGTVREVPVPEPEPGEVRIRVAAAGLNPFDNAVISGAMKDRMEHLFPLIPGSDASGVVEAVGDDVSGFSTGDEVFGSAGKRVLGRGTLAGSVTMSTGTIARKPGSLDHPVAAAIPVAGVTALVMVESLDLEEGQVVVAFGTTGGVGSYFVQLASREGAEVVAVCSEQNAGYARSLGASEVIDYSSADVAQELGSRHPDGIDAVADIHGGKDQLSRLAELVREGGSVASCVGSADVDGLVARGIAATNVFGAVTTERLEELAAMFETKDLVAPQIRTFPLTGSAEAFELLATGHVRGKLVVLPS
jgi:NADPH2:quinone reductase